MCRLECFPPGFEGDEDVGEEAPGGVVQAAERSEAAADGDTKPSTTTSGNSLGPKRETSQMHQLNEFLFFLPARRQTHLHPDQTGRTGDAGGP